MRKVGDKMSNNRTRQLVTPSHTSDYDMKREQAQTLTFEQLQELVQRNVSRNVSKTYTQYTKDIVKTYLQNPASSLSRIIEISRFLERNSTLYKKIIMYYASLPLFYYDLTQMNDYTKSVKANKIIKDYCTVAKRLNGFNIAKEFYNSIYCTIRDGMFVGYLYGDEEHSFFMPLDIAYCRIYGKNEAGEWITYFDASFFKSGNNSIYVEGIDGDITGTWDEVFVNGYKEYQTDNNKRWFRLPPERTFTLIAGSDDQFDVPLPFFAPLFISLMDLADQESIIASKTELENYKLLVSKIPLMKNTDSTDDFAISLKFANQFNSLLMQNIPELVAAVTSPMDLEVIDFNKSNTTDDTDQLSNSIQNLFNNAGVSQIVVAGGLSSNSVGLRHALENDMSNAWVYVNRIESWLNYYIKVNISENYHFEFHRISWYNADDYIKEKKELACVGASAMAMLTATGLTPYIAYQKLNFENTIGFKDLLVPLNTSYTQSGNNGKTLKKEDDLSVEGLKTRIGDKNGSETI